MNGKYLKKVLFGAGMAVSAFFINCSPADLSSLERPDEEGNLFYLTSPFIAELDPNETPHTPPLPYKYIEYPVNPNGLEIKRTYQTADGVYHIELKGDEVDAGIPNGLNGILVNNLGLDNVGEGDNLKYYPFAVDYETDYILQKLSDADATSYYAQSRYPGFTRDKILEDAISLGGLWDNNKFTALTINGLLPDVGEGGEWVNDSLGNGQWKGGNSVVLIETNYSLWLLTQKFIDGYNAQNAFYVRTASTAYKKLAYGKSPNYFLEGAFPPKSLADPPDRGGITWNNYNVVSPSQDNMPYNLPTWLNHDSDRKTGPGGFSLLIWNGVTGEKKATYKVSVDGERFWKKIEVDWSEVNFKDVNLEYMQWYAADPREGGGDLVGIETNAIHPITVAPDADGIIKIFHAFVGNSYEPFSLQLGGDSKDNFVAPSFIPANSTNKKIYFDATTYPSTPTQAITAKPDIASEPMKIQYFPEGTNKDNYVLKAEIADRIKLTPGARNALEEQTDLPPYWVVVYCDTYPPPNGDIDAANPDREKAVPIKLIMQVDVTE